jgi:hypothetical protein
MEKAPASVNSGAAFAASALASLMLFCNDIRNIVFPMRKR